MGVHQIKISTATQSMPPPRSCISGHHDSTSYTPVASRLLVPSQLLELTTSTCVLNLGHPLDSNHLRPIRRRSNRDNSNMRPLSWTLWSILFSVSLVTKDRHPLQVTISLFHISVPYPFNTCTTIPVFIGKISLLTKFIQMTSLTHKTHYNS